MKSTWKTIKIRLSTYQAIRRLAAEWLCGIDDAIARLIAEYQARHDAQREQRRLDVLREELKSAYWYGEETGDYDMRNLTDAYLRGIISDMDNVSETPTSTPHSNLHGA